MRHAVIAAVRDGLEVETIIGHECSDASTTVVVRDLENEELEAVACSGVDRV